MNEETNETYLREFLPRAVFTKMKRLHWYKRDDTGALSMALFAYASDTLRAALRKAGIDDERMTEYYYGKTEGAEHLTEWCNEAAQRIVQRSFAAWGEVAAEIDSRVERDIKAIREAA